MSDKLAVSRDYLVQGGARLESATLEGDLNRYGDQQQCCERDHETKRTAQEAVDDAEEDSLAIRPRLLPSPDRQQEHREWRPGKDVGGVFQNSREIVSKPVGRRFGVPEGAKRIPASDEKADRPRRESTGEKHGQLDRKLINHPPGGTCPEWRP